MRMFSVVMMDVFLILYLTAIATVQSPAVLTVEDFYKLKSLHETLAKDKDKVENELKKELQQVQLKLAEQQDRTQKMEATLLVSDAELARISQDLKTKDDVLKEREVLLKDLDQKIESKETLWQKMEVALKEELKDQQKTVEVSQMMAKKLQLEAQKAQKLADQMLQEADQANKTAETAIAVQQKAIILKEEALKEKDAALRQAETAMAARSSAEEEKERALQAAREAQQRKAQAEAKALKLATAIKDIKQDGDTAFARNVRPYLQQLHVAYERKDGNDIIVFRREMTLLPLKIGDQVYVVFPIQQIGFNTKSDSAPVKLQITYQGQGVTQGLINGKDDLMAILLSGYEGKSFVPYPAHIKMPQMMPTLLAVRNNGNKSLGDMIRGLSDEYFIANRDFVQSAEDGSLEYAVTGFRGTGTYGERIARGDQLTDLNGRLIGVAKDANILIRIDSVSGWKAIAL